jgi:hypothetical protein
MIINLDLIIEYYFYAIFSTYITKKRHNGVKVKHMKPIFQDVELFITILKYISAMMTLYITVD